MGAYDRKDLIVTKMLKYWTQGKNTLKQLHMLELNQFKRKNTAFFFFFLHVIIWIPVNPSCPGFRPCCRNLYKDTKKSLSLLPKAYSLKIP